MHRWFRLSALLAVFVLTCGVAFAQNQVIVTGRIAQNDVRVFVRDSVYQISGTYMVAGTLVIEPGTTIEFLPNGSRIIDSVGGRIIADGRARSIYSGTSFATTSRQGGGFCYDYSDPAYFLSNLVISTSTQIEPTVHPAKRDITNNVILDTLARRIENLPVPPFGTTNTVYVSWPVAVNPPAGTVPGAGTMFLANPTPTVVGGNAFYNTKFVVSYEYALMWITARLSNPNLDPAIRTRAWTRFNFQSPNVGGPGRDRIRFIGKPVNNISREWGHMIILPGARAAFFRDCDFENFRKDSTVDRVNIYQTAGAGSATAPGTLNFNLVSQTQGSGAVLSILSSRTWLVNCSFNKNQARYHGGAIQFLQAPIAPTGNGQYPAALTTGTAANGQYLQMPTTYAPTDLGNAAGTGPIIVNQYLFEQNANNTSTLLAPPRINSDPANPLYVRAHDNLYNGAIKEMDDENRQLIDDGRLAVYLGRIRQLNFVQNRVFNANTIQITTNQGVLVSDDENNPAAVEASATRAYKNEAYGGAVYINGRWGIDIGLGMNNFQGIDFVSFDGNMARNHQPTTGTSGARGGAVYVAGNTALTTTGRYRSNSTETKFIADYNAAALNQGGAIYMSATGGRLMLRGGQDVQVPMHMISNSAARGGAIYVDENFSTDPNRPSPHVGGSNGNNVAVRNLGYNIKFQNNTAKYDGGAIFAKRNYMLTGAGGVVSNVLLGYSTAHLLEFSGNTAGYSGGAIAIHMRSNITEPERGYLRVIRSVFDNNRVGESVTDSVAKQSVRGGGALYVLNAELQTVLGSEFRGNLAQYGNGGAIALINPKPSFTGAGSGGNFQRVFASDLDVLTYGANPAFITSFTSTNDPFTFNPTNAFPPHIRMLTRFLDNRSIENPARMGDGVTQAGNILTYHPGTGATTGPDAGIGGSRLQENGTGLGGALYVVDEINASRAGRIDSIFFNRVRMQNQSAYSGAAIYSDNYDLKMVLLRNFIANNTATSTQGADQNAITGPLTRTGTPVQVNNPASSDLAGTILYGEIIGPLPYSSFSVAGNSIYDNNGRFLIRMPDAPNTKGIFAGTTGIGYGGTDTLRGNYWGKTEANVTTKVYRFDGNGDRQDSVSQNTFFVAGDGTQQLRYIAGGTNKDQGPFESVGVNRYSYEPIPMLNGADNKTPDASSIPEKLLQQGRVYDVFDKGTDVKTADYSARRMSPIEDFAVGIPTDLRRFTNTNQPSFNKFIKRYTRDPFVAEKDANVAALQTEFKGDHPIGYPLFLETQADYSTKDASLNNNDARSINETVFFVINTTTGDYIRVNMQQLDATSETFRSRVDIVPDSTNGGQIAGGYQVRRNAEGLANFGTDLASILSAIKRNADNEDAGTLPGRKYEASVSFGELGGSGFTLSNRPAYTGNATYFAGERYNAIPAKVGDQIAIVSRSVLWREIGSNNDAFSGALIFRVGASTPPPVWTGNVPQTRFPLQANGQPVPPVFRNIIFVSEDRVYNRDANDASRPAGRDTIMAITARDTNLFYDPRSILDPSKYSQLSYGWSVDPNSGLARWLQADTIKADDATNPWWQARGYIRLKGQPSNPYVVPGGESITVTARNFPPNFATIDSMKAAGVAADVIAKYIYLYPSYFANQSYDASNARWLQQDTVNYGWNADTAYTYKVFVTDSLPVFTDNAYACSTRVGNNVIILANLTDSLRFRVDYNTDDEAEDAAAAATGWDYRYGRTSYYFKSFNRGRNDLDKDTASDQISIVRPVWLSNQYLRKYDDRTQMDPFASDFLSKGQLSISIDSATAVNILSPVNRRHNALNTDTIMTVVANDGHGGITAFTSTILVNIPPTILNESLPDAKEDEDYNPPLMIDSNRRIIASDPNFGQVQKFELIYSNDPRKAAGIPRDPCFSEAGNWNISDAATPDWLKVNESNGILYGIPRVRDARLTDTTVTVTALVTDNGGVNGLTHVKKLQLRIIGVNHDPMIMDAPAIRCVENGQNFVDSVWVRDIDLRRSETVTVTVAEPPGLTVEPSTIPGYRTNDSVRVLVKGNPFNITPYRTSVRVVLVVSDANGGKVDSLIYTINVSEQTLFTARLTVANNLGANQTLDWGSATNATTGDDPNRGGIGKLDSNYCEYELPPIPPLDVFDARWTVPSKNGVLRDIFPSCVARDARLEAYKGRFQAGGVIGGTSNTFPVTLKWKKSEVPARTDAQKNPCGGSYFLRDAAANGQLFNINMNSGGAFISSRANFDIIENGDDMTLVIKQDAINTFMIVWDQATDVENDPIAGDLTEFALAPISPNPTNGASTVKFNVPSTSKVAVEVFDNLGNKVATLANGVYGVGQHTIEWNGQNGNGMDLISGAYTVKMTAGAFSTVQRVVIVR